MARRFQSDSTADLSMGGSGWTSNGSHTLAAWFYVTNPAPNGCDALYGDTSTNGSQSGQSIWMGCNSSTQWSFQEDGGTYSFTTAATTNTWTHLCLTYDGTNCRAYINGSLQNTGAFNVGTRAAFFWFDTGFGTDCHTQDNCVFNAALTQPEIVRLMRERRPGSQLSSLFLWWPQVSGAHTFDYSGNRNNWSADGSSAPTTFPAVPFSTHGPRRIWVPPGTAGAIAGASGIQSAASGSLSTAAALTGASGVQSAASGTRSLAVALTGASGVQSAASGNVAVAAALVGASGVQSAANGNLSVAAALAGTSGIQTAATGSFQQGAVSGASGIQSAASGSRSVDAALSGSAGVQSSASANRSQQNDVVATSGIASAANGNVSVAQLIQLVGTCGIASAADGARSEAHALAGAAGIQTGANGNASGVTTPVSGASGVASGASGVISVQFILDDRAIYVPPWAGWPGSRRR